MKNISAKTHDFQIHSQKNRIKTAAILSVACCIASFGWGASTLALAEEANPSYQEIAQTLKPVQVSSTQQLRENIQELNGFPVELHGDVTGIMTREGARTVLLRLVDGTVLMSVPPGLMAPALRAGASVRVLARVNATADSGITVIAAAEAPRIVASAQTSGRQGNGQTPDHGSKSTVPPGDGAEIIAVNNDQADGGFELPQPPADLPVAKPIITPNPPRMQPRPQPAPTASRSGNARVPQSKTAAERLSSPAPATRLSEYEAEDVIDSQKEAYESLVRRHNKKLKPEVVEEIAVALLRAGYQYNMDPRFLAAIIAVESTFDVNCLSRSGAMGLGQIMPFNLKEAGIKNPWNPTENVFGTARLLRGHLNSYKTRENGTLLAVAAYNAGPGAVRRAGYKVPPGAQVQRYVWKVYYRYKAFAPDMF